MLEHANTPDLGPYLLVACTQLKILSVFDDLRYDRSDADMLSPAMRKHVVVVLGKIGFRQTSGTVLEHCDTGVRCHMPKFHALGASPFDAIRYTNKRPQDYYVLTPTQTACQFVDQCSHEEAVDRVRALIAKQPINLYRLMDYLERKPAHQDFLNAIGHLKYVQRTAVESEPLRSQRALG
ncbi:MAG: hypothetical protein AAF724_15165 [Pseudomonadota bacterium]